VNYPKGVGQRDQAAALLPNPIKKEEQGHSYLFGRDQSTRAAGFEEFWIQAKKKIRRNEDVGWDSRKEGMFLKEAKEK